MNKAVLNEIISLHQIEIIEKHLVFSFLKNKNLEYRKNPILINFFEDFEPDEHLIFQISDLKIQSLKLLETYLELLIPKSDRKLNGAFFTPTYIVNFIIEEISPKINDKCLDPSCGCGAFLIGLVEYYRENFNKTVKEIIQQNIFGSDILDYNVRRTKVILSIFGLLNNEIIEESDFNIQVQDSLRVKWTKKFEVIVGNPPYVKYQDLSDENRRELVNRWQTIETGTFNIYFAFFELGHKLLEKNGKLGFITPNNYFTSLAALPLRKYFTQAKCLSRIADFSHRKVFDAQTYTAITFLENNKFDSILYDKIKTGQECESFLSSLNGSPNYLKNLNIKKWRLLKTREQENIRIIENIGTPIKQLFNIAVGIATLKDEVFFVDSATKKNGLIEKITDNGTFYIEEEITKPVYKISKFKSQEEIYNNTLRIITPYHTSTKNASPILEDEFKIKYPNCYEYLLSEKEKLNKRSKGKGNYSPFYVWGRTQGINRFGKKILNPTFSKTPRFLYVPEQESYYTNGYGIYFSKDQSKGTSLFDDSTHPISKEENILIAQKILNSVVMDYYVTKTSVAIQGGFPCYQKNFIEKFSIPHFTNLDLEKLENFSNKEDIDNFLIKKYGLNI